jgi:hypothetical protein
MSPEEQEQERQEAKAFIQMARSVWAENAAQQARDKEALFGRERRKTPMFVIVFAALFGLMVLSGLISVIAGSQ